jgi:hypothetical protein
LVAAKRFVNHFAQSFVGQLFTNKLNHCPRQPVPERRVEAERPGKLVAVDCFVVGRLSGTKRRSLAVGLA